MCVVCRWRDVDGRMLGCWGLKEGYICHGELEKEMLLVLWELW